MTRPLAPPLRGVRDFNLLWFGEGVSLLGSTTTAILLPLLAVVSFGAGPWWVGVLTASAWLPWLVVGLPIGAWVDLHSPRAVMLSSDLVAAALLTSVPVAAAAGVLSMQQLVLVAFGNGTCTVFFRAAYPALVRHVAPAERQEEAFARLFGTESAAQVVGPGVGGALAQLGSAAFGLLMDAASYVVSALCLARMRKQAPAPRPDVVAPLRTRIAEGLRYLREDRLLTFFTVAGGVSNFGLTGASALSVLFMVRELDLGPGAVGLVAALGSMGGLLGAVVATRASRAWGSARALRRLQLLAGPPALLVLLAAPGPRVAWMVAGTLLVGVGVVAGNVIKGAWRNRYVPAHLMARQVTTAQLVNFGTMPLAGLAAGYLGSTLGLRPTIALMGLIHVVACLSLLRSPIRGLREMPAPTAELASDRLAA